MSDFAASPSSLVYSGICCIHIDLAAFLFVYILAFDPFA